LTFEAVWFFETPVEQTGPSRPSMNGLGSDGVPVFGKFVALLHGGPTGVNA
jgi:hypothetical protein